MTRRPWWCGGALIAYPKPRLINGKVETHERTKCDNEADPKYGLCGDCIAKEARQRADLRHAKEKREQAEEQAKEQKQKRYGGKAAE